MDRYKALKNKTYKNFWQDTFILDKAVYLVQNKTSIFSSMQVYSHKQQYQKCLCMCGRLAFIQCIAFTFAKKVGVGN